MPYDLQLLGKQNGVFAVRSIRFSFFFFGGNNFKNYMHGGGLIRTVYAKALERAR